MAVRNENEGKKLLAAEAQTTHDGRRVLYVGANQSQFQSAALTSTIDLYQFDTIIIEIRKLIKEATDSSGVPTRASIERLAKRLRELDSWVRAGHTLIVLIDSLWEKSFAHSGRTQTFRIAAEPPFVILKYQEGSGDRTDFCGAKEYADFFDELKGRITFSYVISADGLQPLLKVQQASGGRPNRIVGGYVRADEGLVFYLPALTTAENINSLSRLAAIKPWSGDAAPEWVSSLLSVDEAKLSAQVFALKAEIAVKTSAMEFIENEAAAYAGIKRLLFSTGDEFKDAVASALKELGLAVVDGPHPRADLLATNGTVLLAVEAKGLEGPVREQNVTQAFRWLGEIQATIMTPVEERGSEPDLRRYGDLIESLGLSVEAMDITNCRGLVCVGTFRKTPFLERREPDYPEPVRRLLARQQYESIGACRGVDLMLGVLAMRTQRASSHDVVQMLTQSNGIVTLPFTWADFSEPG